MNRLCNLVGLVGLTLLLIGCGAGPPAFQGPTPTHAKTQPTAQPTPGALQQGGYLAESVNMGSEGSWAIFWDPTPVPGTQLSAVVMESPASMAQPAARDPQ